jgi:hypothetical protein
LRVSTRREMLILGGLALGVGALTGVAEAGPRKHAPIHAAINELKNAREYLQAASHNFGGHRAKAIGKIDVAVEELRVCLNY